MAALGFLRAPTVYFNNITQIPVNNLTHPPPLSSQSKITIKKEARCFFSLGRRVGCFPLACLPPHPSPHFASCPKTRLFVSGLSFRTTEHGLRNAFQGFGQLVEVNLVMDKIANRPRGFAFVRYETEEESQRAIEGMHGKFLDGRVIFVEIAKPRAELRQASKQNPRQN